MLKLFKQYKYLVFFSFHDIMLTQLKRMLFGPSCRLSLQFAQNCVLRDYLLQIRYRNNDVGQVLA